MKVMIRSQSGGNPVGQIQTKKYNLVVFFKQLLQKSQEFSRSSKLQAG